MTRWPVKAEHLAGVSDNINDSCTCPFQRVFVVDTNQCSVMQNCVLQTFRGCSPLNHWCSPAQALACRRLWYGLQTHLSNRSAIKHNFVGNLDANVVRTAPTMNGIRRRLLFTAAASEGATSQPYHSTSNRSPPNQNYRHSSEYNAKYEQELRSLQAVLTPEAIAELTATLPPSDLQNLQRVLADIKLMESGALRQASQTSSKAKTQGTSMAETTPGVRARAHARRSSRQTVGMDAAARLAAQQQAAKRVAADLGLPFDFYR